MKNSTKVTWLLLKPHVRPYLGAFVLILVLGMIGAMGNRSAVILTDPLLDTLFGPEQKETALDPHEKRAEFYASVLGEFSEDATKEEKVERAKRLVAVHVPSVLFTLAHSDFRPQKKISIDPLGLSKLGDKFRDQRSELYAKFLGPLPENPTKDQEFARVRRIVIVFAIMALLTAITVYVFTMLTRWVGLKMIIGLRMRIANHLLAQSARYHGNQKFGDLLSRISTDVHATLVVVNSSLKELVEQPMLALVSIVGAFAVAPLPTLYLALTLPLLMLPIAVLTKRIRKRSKKSLVQLGASVQVLTQMFQGIRTVKAFRAEEREMERFANVNESYLGATMKMVRAIASTHSLTQMITSLGMGVLLITIGWFTVHQNMFTDRNELLMLILFVAPLYTAIKKSTKVWTRVQESVGASMRLQELLDAPVELVEKDNATSISALGSGIDLKNVSFAYDPEDNEGAPAITDVSLHIKPGETLALVGPSGAGKSTLMDLLARFLDPDEGSISIDGHDLRDLTLDSVAGLYAMVGQHPFLFHATIEENIRYGKHDATHAEIEEAARAANIHDFILTLPDGYNTDVAEAGSRLSGGQRQRITIARAILKSAPLLLLDEATSALDTESEQVVQEAIENLMENHTVVVIAHRLSTIRTADRIAVMEHGRLVEIGTHEELLTANGLYARLHDAQFAGAGVTTD